MATEKMSTPAETSVRASCAQKEKKARFFKVPEDFCRPEELWGWLGAG